MDERQRAVRILDKVLELTKAGNAEWQRGQVATAYLLPIGNETLRIVSRDQDEAPPYLFTILNSSMEAVARLESQPRSAGGQEPELNTKLDELFKAARDSVLGTKNVFADIERQLGI